LAKPKPTRPLDKSGKNLVPQPPKDETVKVSFRHYDAGGPHCLMHCNPDEVRLFLDCFRRLSSMSFYDVLQSGRKGAGKTGLNHTNYDDSAFQGATRPVTIPRDVRLCGMRAGSDRRVFGFFHERVFYVLWFDPAHRLIPS
jgi:hypothetical protein